MSIDESRRNTLRSAPAWVHAVSWGIFGAITLVLVILYIVYRDTDVWKSLSDAQVGGRHAFNEAIYGSIYRQRANTLSNLGYVLVGIYAMAYAWWDYRRPTSETDPYAVRSPGLMAYFGVTCIVLGFGSGLMHGAMTPWGHKLDVLGMLATVTALMALSVARWIPGVRVAGRFVPLWPLFAFLAGAGSIYYTLNLGRFHFGNGTYAGMIAIIGAGIAVEILAGRTSFQYRWTALSGASLALAYLIWNFDKAGTFSSRESWFQGHALWHLLTAVTLGCAANFYRAELPIKQKD